MKKTIATLLLCTAIAFCAACNAPLPTDVETTEEVAGFDEPAAAEEPAEAEEKLIDMEQETPATAAEVEEEAEGITPDNQHAGSAYVTEFYELFLDSSEYSLGHLLGWIEDIDSYQAEKTVEVYTPYKHLGQATLGGLRQGYKTCSRDIINVGFPTNALPQGPYFGLPAGVNGLPRPVGYRLEEDVIHIIADIEGDGITEKMVIKGDGITGEIALNEKAIGEWVLIEKLVSADNNIFEQQDEQKMAVSFPSEDDFGEISFYLLDVDGDNVYELIVECAASEVGYTQIYRFNNGGFMPTDWRWAFC